MEIWAPSTEEIAIEMQAYLGGFVSAFSYRVEETFFMQTFVFLTTFFWRASAMMLLGMALYKSGFFHLAWSSKKYMSLFGVGLIVGTAITAYGAYMNVQHEFALEFSMFGGSQYNYWGSILLALAYSSVVIALVKSERGQQFQRVVSAVGKTAFSNYILQTLICTTLFYGYGLSLFGELDRLQLFALVIVICSLQVVLSVWWLRHFRMGPLEWCWRGLTYGKLPSIR